jgi:putative SOS response-associated peptidase YedK
MPVILREEDYDLWLDPGVTDSNLVVDCLKPFDTTLMKKYPVSTRVNRPENDDQECAREIPIAAPCSPIVLNPQEILIRELARHRE